MKMFNFRGLEALVAFVEAGSIAKAAEQLDRTPPQIGRLLNALEAELGFTVFDRRSKPLALTKEGRNFALQVKVALAGVGRLGAVARQLRSMERAHLRILTAPFLAPALVIDAIGRVAQRYPEFTAEIDSRIRLDIEEWIQKESFDIGIAVLPIQSAAFRTEPLIEVEAMCAMSVGHPLAERAVVEFEDLIGLELVMQHPRSKVRTFIEGLARQRGTNLDIRFEAPNGIIATQMVARGLGCGIIDPLVAQSAGAANLVLRPFRPSLKISYGFVFPEWVVPSPLINSLMDEIRRACTSGDASRLRNLV
ncbi:LysR family transcriptional regulator [Bosea beijingensis]|uniref:LysR family transcriptional regulator n=1 Tax=Bosea beijingensis TaxID=3068632 RepID=UPI0027406BF1|nr:LysR family transcriptional regulator [Bosea sp. REN20]